MGSVTVAETMHATVHEAETRWYDTDRWPVWVEGLARVVSVVGDWPETGAIVTWESGPAGRGRVTERVVEHEPLSGQTLEVEDDSIRGRQTVAFTPEEEGVEVSLTLEYEIKRRSILTPLLDVLFIRRAMAASLRSTVARFALELTTAR